MMTKKKIQIHKSVLITGLLCITFLEYMALMMGIDGLLLTTVIAVIAGAMGLSLPQIKLK